jgi:hypothetical protein
MAEKRLTAGKAVRKHCVSCVGGVVADVHACGGEKVKAFGNDEGACRFMPFRLGRGRVSVKLIRAFCMVCQGDQRTFVRECHETKCHFHEFRMGKNPARSGYGNAANLVKNDS